MHLVGAYVQNAGRNLTWCIQQPKYVRQVQDLPFNSNTVTAKDTVLNLKVTFAKLFPYLITKCGIEPLITTCV